MCLGLGPELLERRGHVRDWGWVSLDSDICRLGLCTLQDDA